MSIFKRIFGSNNPAIPKKDSAKLAKERLQIIVSHERSKRVSADFLPSLQKELIEVIAKYVEIDKEQVKVELERVGDRSVLELNVALPDISAKQSDLAEA